ncbi:MAG TPA: CaiB/BaiF CoA-transferase family protein [Mycobacteriales bacterium]|nr:CaiB/BaiF CoA-transferase family protein [Mycobacteriales bacterium]
MAGLPLDGVRVLSIEQMQALPFATQLLGRLGADVVKVEAPHGDQARSSFPAITDPDGRSVGATFLRNNLNKRSICIDCKQPEGRDLVLALAPKFDIVAENARSGATTKLGLGYEDICAVHPSVIYLSISGFGNSVPSPYRDWPAFAAVAEAMSGIYEAKRPPDGPPMVAPVGALGDISAALFATIGLLAALRQRDATGEAQYVDIAMLDSVVAMTDVVTNFWSLGGSLGRSGAIIMDGFRASDGWFVIHVGREHQFRRLVELIGRPEWVHDPRFATREGWREHLESAIRPAVEAWAADQPKVAVCQTLADAGIAAGPCFTDEEVAHDPHLAARHMMVAMPRTDGVEQPVLVPGNPVKIAGVPEVEDRRVPWLGEHTDEVLRAELGLSETDLAGLRSNAVIR